MVGYFITNIDIHLVSLAGSLTTQLLIKPVTHVAIQMDFSYIIATHWCWAVTSIFKPQIQISSSPVGYLYWDYYICLRHTWYMQSGHIIKMAWTNIKQCFRQDGTSFLCHWWVCLFTTMMLDYYSTWAQGRSYLTLLSPVFTVRHSMIS